MVAPVARKQTSASHSAQARGSAVAAGPSITPGLPGPGPGQPGRGRLPRRRHRDQPDHARPPRRAPRPPVPVRRASARLRAGPPAGPGPVRRTVGPGHAALHRDRDHDAARAGPRGGRPGWRRPAGVRRPGSGARRLACSKVPSTSVARRRRAPRRPGPARWTAARATTILAGRRAATAATTASPPPPTNTASAIGQVVQGLRRGAGHDPDVGTVPPRVGRDPGALRRVPLHRDDRRAEPGALHRRPNPMPAPTSQTSVPGRGPAGPAPAPAPRAWSPSSPGARTPPRPAPTPSSRRPAASPAGPSRRPGLRPHRLAPARPIVDRLGPVGRHADAPFVINRLAVAGTHQSFDHELAVAALGLVGLTWAGGVVTGGKRAGVGGPGRPGRGPRSGPSRCGRRVGGGALGDPLVRRRPGPRPPAAAVATRPAPRRSRRGPARARSARPPWGKPGTR